MRLNINSFFFLACLFMFSACSTQKKTTYRKPSSKSTYTPSSKKASGSSVVQIAKQMIGRPYRYAGSTRNGFDCSGLSYYAFGEANIQLPRTSQEQSRRGQSINPKQAKPGDLLFFGTGSRVTHVGIVSKSGAPYPTMIHSSSSKGVIETNVSTSTYWKKKILFARRITR